jgi:hypothetical protein
LALFLQGVGVPGLAKIYFNTLLPNRFAKEFAPIFLHTIEGRFCAFAQDARKPLFPFEKFSKLETGYRPRVFLAALQVEPRDFAFEFLQVTYDPVRGHGAGLSEIKFANRVEGFLFR